MRNVLPKRMLEIEATVIQGIFFFKSLRHKTRIANHLWEGISLKSWEESSGFAFSNWRFVENSPPDPKPREGNSRGSKFWRGIVDQGESKGLLPGINTHLTQTMINQAKTSRIGYVCVDFCSFSSFPSVKLQK